MSARQKILVFLFLAAIFLFLPKKVLAQVVVINEILPNPPGESSENGEYIELYSNELVNIGEWILDDQEAGSDSYTIPEGTQIGGDQKFLIFYKSTTGIGLNNSDPDMVRLFKPGVTDPEDIYSFDIKGGYEGVAFGRVPDGPGGIWVELSANSPGAANSPAPTPTSTSTNTPTPTPIPESPTSTPTPKLPTSTPKPPTPVPTSTPKTPTSTPTPKPTIKPSPTATVSGEILGQEESSAGAFYPWEATKEAEPVLGEKSSSPSRLLPAVLLGAGFVLLFSAAFWLWYTQLKK